MKPLRFVGSALEDLQGFSIAARRAAGFELWAVQRGLLPSDWKALPAVGAGAYEMRIHVLGEWRVIYVAKFTKSIYILHAFQKKSQKTRAADIALAARRFKQIEGEA